MKCGAVNHLITLIWANMFHVCAEGFLDLNFNQAIIDGFSKFSHS